MALTSEQLKRLRQAPAEDGRNRVRMARELAKMTQVQLAAALGVTQSSLSDLERQRYGGTTVDTARKFAEFFGCHIEDLFPSRAQVA
jgi:DNA-binding XRE family transcriptional regulator